MSAQLFLIAPDDLDVGLLTLMLAAAEVSALLVPRRNLAENAYKAMVKAIRPHAQEAGCAVLVEGEPGLVRLLGADGLHLGESSKGATIDAVRALKPDLIVGAWAANRDEAMTKGELGVVYLFFGPLSGQLDERDRALAAWWAQTMEVPAVLSDPAASPESLDPLGCEFAALSENLWNAKEGPARAIAAFARRLEAV